MVPRCKRSDLHALEAHLAGSKGGAGADSAGGPVTATTHTAQHSAATTYILPTPAARAADRRVCADLTQTGTLDITASAQVRRHPECKIGSFPALMCFNTGSNVEGSVAPYCRVVFPTTIARIYRGTVGHTMTCGQARHHHKWPSPTSGCVHAQMQERRTGPETTTSEVSTRAADGICATAPAAAPPAAMPPLPKLPEDRSECVAVSSADGAQALQQACSGAGAAPPQPSDALHSSTAAATRPEPTAFLRGANAGHTGHSSASGGSGTSAEATVTLQQPPRLGTPATGACALLLNSLAQNTSVCLIRPVCMLVLHADVNLYGVVGLSRCMR